MQMLKKYTRRIALTEVSTDTKETKSFFLDSRSRLCATGGEKTCVSTCSVWEDGSIERLREEILGKSTYGPN